VSRHHVLLLPGGVLPAALAYADLLPALGSDVDAVAKDLELYRAGGPPRDYSLDLEVAGVLREADSRGWDRFHLLGYSGGGAAALAVAADHGERLRSLALLEPAWAGHWEWSPDHHRFWESQDALSRRPDEEFLAEFMRLAVAPDVPLPPPPAGDPPPWMSVRPAGIQALVNAFMARDLDRDALARFTQPVYFAVGGLSNTDQYAEIADRLGRVFPDFRLETFPDRHHFDPPHRAEPQALAGSLRELWDRAEPAAS
jgi:pimeloyl-ACP methyl ester carboxylesterase